MHVFEVKSIARISYCTNRRVGGDARPAHELTHHNARDVVGTEYHLGRGIVLINVRVDRVDGQRGRVDRHGFRNFVGQSLFSSYQRVGSNLGHPGRFERSRRIGGGGGVGLRFRQRTGMFCKRVGRHTLCDKGSRRQRRVGRLVGFVGGYGPSRGFCSTSLLHNGRVECGCVCRCTGETRVGESRAPSLHVRGIFADCVCVYAVDCETCDASDGQFAAGRVIGTPRRRRGLQCHGVEGVSHALDAQFDQ